MSENEHIQYTLQQLIETWKQLSLCIAKHPDKLIENQLSYWQAYTKLYQAMDPELSQQASSDKRFNYKDWQESISHHFIKQSYLLLAKQIHELIDDVTEGTDVKAANKLKFYSRQWIDALSPTNFAHLNPEVFSKTLETNGDNLIKGMKQFLEDIERGKGQFTIKNTDSDYFKLGENIACTKGDVIYQNDLMQLIQYHPNTQKVYQIPLLIIPPWINKYYILDLQQENSLVKWLVDQGFTVFMISWVNPDIQHKDKKFDDYMLQGPLAALSKIKQITGEEKINILGYCIGGTLLGCLLAYLTKKNEMQIHSATFLTTLFDFSEPGELGIFMDENQLTLLEKQMQTKGYLDGHIMGAVFNALRANDLIWSAFINTYLKGQQPKPFDLLHWNADSTNIPKEVHSFYLRNMYLENDLIQPNKIKLADIPLDLGSIKVPSYFLAAQDDHIVPWQSAYKSSQYYGGKVKFVLTTSGHVAGVVNPPHKNKYGYYTNDKRPKNPDNYLSGANFTQGSWWNDWVKWLTSYSGKMQSSDYLKRNQKTVIEKAPGSYVKVKLKAVNVQES